jgi:hypothetical protein
MKSHNLELPDSRKLFILKDLSISDRIIIFVPSICFHATVKFASACPTLKSAINFCHMPRRQPIINTPVLPPRKKKSWSAGDEC